MIKDHVSVIQETVCGEKAFANVREIVTHHRVQASPGYRAAAEYCLGYLRRHRVKADIESYPAREGAQNWQMRMFKEWRCTDAWLELEGEPPLRLADFRANPMSVMQRSLPADYRKRPLEVVLLDKGPDAAAYGDIDLAGKLVFIGGNPAEYLDWAIHQRGAAGIVTDHMPEMPPVRQRCDLPDATTNLSFHWGGGDGGRSAFGFVLTPRLGDRLRAACHKRRAEFEAGKAERPWPKAHAYVDSELYDGAIEVVAAEIPGATDETVYLCAHLCHPRQCANDNASGAAAAMEAARALQAAIDTGRLPKPRRTVKVILVPEFTGVYAHLAGLEDAALGKIMAGLNMDMVGGKQDTMFGPLVVMSQPDAAPSFIKDLALLVLGEVKKEYRTLALDEYVSTFVSGQVRFSSGSDHSIFSDPTVGAPCIALTQSPDKTYHTSLDTLEQVDPKMLARSAALAAGYLYTLATLTVEDAREIMLRSRANFMETFGTLAGSCLDGALEPGAAAQQMRYRQMLCRQGCEDYRRFFTGGARAEVDRLIERECAWMDKMLSHYLAQLPGAGAPAESAEKPAAGGTVFRRLFKGPLIATHFEKYLSPEHKAQYEALKRDHPGGSSAEVSTVYWCDGKRTTGEIAHLVKMDKGVDDPAFVQAYLAFLEAIGLVAAQAPAVSGQEPALRLPGSNP